MESHRQENQQGGKIGRVKTVRGALYNNLIILEVVVERTKLYEHHTPLSVRKKLIERTKKSHLNFQTLRTNASLTLVCKNPEYPKLPYEQ